MRKAKEKKKKWMGMKNYVRGEWKGRKEREENEKKEGKEKKRMVYEIDKEGKVVREDREEENKDGWGRTGWAYRWEEMKIKEMEEDGVGVDKERKTNGGERKRREKLKEEGKDGRKGRTKKGSN